MASVVKTSYAPSTTTYEAPVTNAHFHRDLIREFCEHNEPREIKRMNGLIIWKNNCPECDLKYLKAVKELELQREQLLLCILILSVLRIQCFFLRILLIFSILKWE